MSEDALASIDVGGEMSEQENLKKYMLLGIENITSLKECIKCEILIILLSLPCIVFNIFEKKYLLLFLSLLPAVIHLLSVIKLMSSKKIEGVREILYSGIFLCCMSFIFALGGIEILLYLFTGKERVIMVSMVCVSYILVIKFYEYTIRKQIDKMDDNNAKRNWIWMPFTLFGVLGMSVAKAFVKYADNRTLLVFLFICCMILSYLCLSGIVLFLKYRYIMNHTEILDEYINQLCHSVRN